MKILKRLPTLIATMLLTGAVVVAAATGASAATPTPDTTPNIPAHITAAAAANGFHQLRNAAYNQCVNAPGGGLNVRLQLANCSTASTERWSLVPTGAPNTVSVVNQASGFCMEVNNGTATPGETVDEYICNGSASEQWVQEGLSFRHVGTNQCLDTVGGRGSQLMQFTCGLASPAGAQAWVVV
jgi:Ricin-type beta-trefoil lectin domain